MTKINPYNFVPFKGKEPQRNQWKSIPKHHRLEKRLYSGCFELKITTITPVFIPSPAQQDKDVEKINVNRKIREKVTFKKFIHRNGKPFIPGSSIKGMARSVFEALTDSCMVLFAETYGSKTYTSGYKNEYCGKENGLCPACSLFGTISGEELAFQGKVFFEDAMGKKEDIETGCWILKELSVPKPERHSPFYALDPDRLQKGPRGRKFYFHHNPLNVGNGFFTAEEHTHRNRKICQILRPDSRLSGKVIFKGLSKMELANLIYTLELDRCSQGEKSQRTMAHKIGMAKPLGLGSVYIEITGGCIEEGASRYKAFCKPCPLERSTIEEFKKEAAKPSEIMKDVLSLEKFRNGTISYPDYGWFTNRNNNDKVLGSLGEYEGHLELPWFPEASSAAIDFGQEINGTIKEVKGDEVVIETEDGKLYKRLKKVAQGIKKDGFTPGLKVILTGKAFKKR